MTDQQAQNFARIAQTDGLLAAIAALGPEDTCTTTTTTASEAPSATSASTGTETGPPSSDTSENTSPSGPPSGGEVDSSPPSPSEVWSLLDVLGQRASHLGREASQRLEIHPHANIFPLMEAIPLAALTESIREHGLQEPIVLDLAQRVLDGRNRLLACRAAGVEPRFVIEGTTDTLAYVVTRNLHRRHLSESQRSVVAARIADTLRGHRAEGSGKVAAEAAAQLNVSTRSVEAAIRVVQDGAPEVTAAVEQGRLAVTAAAELATLPQDEQLAILRTADPKAVAKVAKAQREQKAAKKAETQREQLQERADALGEVDARDVELVRGEAYEVIEGLEAGSIGLVHADPPWSYDVQGGRGAADGHYSTLTMENVAATLELAHEKAADGTYLLLWAVGPLLPAWFIESKDAWSWVYVNAFTWVKTGAPGIGTHMRGDHEHLLLYRKGPARPNGVPLSSVYTSPRTAHSEKPEAWLTQLIQQYSAGRVLDLYAGLGSCARAAVEAGVPYLGVELSEVRHAEASARLRIALADRSRQLELVGGR